jgi:uncharacterized membrane protein
MLRRSFLKSFPPTLLICSAFAQVPVDQSTVTGAIASLDKPTVKAGDTVQLILRFNAPFSRKTSVQAIFRLNNPPYGFAGDVDIPANQLEATIPIKVDAQADAGDYVLNVVSLVSEKRQPQIQVNPPLKTNSIFSSGWNADTKS